MIIEAMLFDYRIPEDSYSIRGEHGSRFNRDEEIYYSLCLGSRASRMPSPKRL